MISLLHVMFNVYEISLAHLEFIASNEIKRGEMYAL